MHFSDVTSCAVRQMFSCRRWLRRSVDRWSDGLQACYMSHVQTLTDTSLIKLLWIGSSHGLLRPSEWPTRTVFGERKQRIYRVFHLKPARLHGEIEEAGRFYVEHAVERILAIPPHPQTLLSFSFFLKGLDLYPVYRLSEIDLPSFSWSCQ